MDITVIKGHIQECISKMELQEAYDLILQYKKIFGYDDEIASMEAIVNIYDSNYEEALKCIRKGLKVNIFNSDLYFTMGNIYELRAKFKNAYLCYEHALNLADNIESKNVILATIDNLKINSCISVNKCSIVILTYNNLDYTKVCIDSIRKYNNRDTYEIIIVDNNSTDGTVEWIKEQKNIKYILNKENKGFPAGCNQGIEIAEKNNDIFLLNNDTVIMPNSIFNLRMGLYSDAKVGATGSVSNSISYYQQISETYTDFDGYMDYALRNNIANDEAYEQRVKLVGFAMLIKRSVLNKVGLLDERFTPGNYEDDDISLRVIKEGYKLLLCKDSYIHHFGSVSFGQNKEKYIRLLNENEKKFKEKWGFTPTESLNIYEQCKKYINGNNNNILEMFCGTGANLLNVKSFSNNVITYGYETNNEIIEVASKSINMLSDLNDEKYKEYFDYIIISHCNKVCELGKLINSCEKLLRDSGEIIFIIDTLKYGNKFDDKFKNYVLKSFGEKLFNNVSFETLNDYSGNVVQAYFVYKKISPKEKASEILDFSKEGKIEKALIELKRFKDKVYNKEIDSILIECESTIEKLTKIKFILRRMEFELNTEENNNELINYVVEEVGLEEAIIEIVQTSIVNKVSVFNYVASIFFNSNQSNYALKFLEAAMKLEPKNKDVLFNIGYILNKIGEKSNALMYLEMIEDKDNEVVNLLQNIRGERE